VRLCKVTPVNLSFFQYLHSYLWCFHGGFCGVKPLILELKMRRFHILVADDDYEDFSTLKEAFGELEVPPSLECLENGRELVNRLADGTGDKSGSIPDLILLDLNMPKMDGVQALEKIRQMSWLNRVPVLVYTTTHDWEQMQACIMRGANGFVTKGDTFSAIVKFAGAICEYIAELDQLQQDNFVYFNEASLRDN
jgi:CheY-like chemotaxis protein